MGVIGGPLKGSHKSWPGYLGEDYPLDPDMSLYEVTPLLEVLELMRKVKAKFGGRMPMNYKVMYVKPAYDSTLPAEEKARRQGTKTFLPKPKDFA